MLDESSRLLHRAREQFVIEGHLDSTLAAAVRPDILVSWRRSRLSGASSGIDVLPFQAEVMHETALCNAAEPILSRLAEQLSGLQAGVLLADRHARILRRWAPQTDILPKMDRIQSVAGSSGSEELVGTNGIGTIAEDQKPHMVVGAEHFAEMLSTFACVGAPIFNPLSRKFAGIVTLNCDATEASPLLTSLVATTAQEIESKLLHNSSRRERALLDSFLVANRSGRAVAVLGDEVLLAGPQVTRMLRSLDQGLVWQQIREGVGRATHSERIVVGTQNGVAALTCTPIRLDDKLIGALVEVIETPDEAPRPAARPDPVATASWPEATLCLPGTSPAWTEVLRRAAGQRRSSVPLLVVGEAGTGKLELIKAMFADQALNVVDCFSAPPDDAAWPLAIGADVPAGWTGAIVLRHIDSLSPMVARALSARLDQLAFATPLIHIVATALPTTTPAQGHQRRLLDQVGVVTIEVPPLRERSEDIPAIVARLNRDHGGTAPLRFSAKAMQALSRAPWPGNARQVETLVRGLLATARTVEITPEMLPDGLGSYSASRQLTKMEELEFNAIVETINRASGNKVETARLLGISRSTLYRKMRQFRLDPDRTFY